MIRPKEINAALIDMYKNMSIPFSDIFTVVKYIEKLEGQLQPEVNYHFWGLTQGE